MLEQLEAGRHSGEPGKFRIAVHSLISSCANVGAMALSSHAAALEEARITSYNVCYTKLLRNRRSTPSAFPVRIASSRAAAWDLDRYQRDRS